MRLIDADALIDDLTERYCKECNKRKGYSGKFIYEIGGTPCRACEVDDVEAELEEAPTVDVPERNVGKWIEEVGMLMCSECGDAWGTEQFDEVMSFNYCPNCGADMRKEIEDEH